MAVEGGKLRQTMNEKGDFIEEKIKLAADIVKLSNQLDTLSSLFRPPGMRLKIPAAASHHHLDANDSDAHILPCVMFWR